MPGEFFEVEVEGLPEVMAELDHLGVNISRAKVPAMQSALFMQQEVLRGFDREGLIEDWVPLAPMTRFIRAHSRKTKRTSNAEPKILQDTGLLKNSIIPFADSDAAFFGIQTNLEYAPLVQFGGIGEANEVKIIGFKRRKPGATAYGVQRNVWDKKKNRMVDRGPGREEMTKRSKDYILHIAAGHFIPPRPFMPRDNADIQFLEWPDEFGNIYREWVDGGMA